MSAAREHSSPIARMLIRHARRLNLLVYPELARLDTEQERDRALGAVGVFYGRRWWYPASIVVTLGGGLIVGVLAAEGLQRVEVPSVVGGRDGSRGGGVWRSRGRRDRAGLPVSGSQPARTPSHSRRARRGDLRRLRLRPNGQCQRAMPGVRNSDCCPRSSGDIAGRTGIASRCAPESFVEYAAKLTAIFGCRPSFHAVEGLQTLACPAGRRSDERAARELASVSTRARRALAASSQGPRRDPGCPSCTAIRWWDPGSLDTRRTSRSILPVPRSHRCPGLSVRYGGAERGLSCRAANGSTRAASGGDRAGAV